jgi:signal transduction histidine kinase
MMELQEDDRVTNHAMLVKKIRTQILEQAEKTKNAAFAAREATIRQRTETINNVRERLKDTTNLIQHKHEVIRRKLSQEAVHREANIRVNRGLDALEKFIQILRESDLNTDMLEKAIRDPIISKSLKSEARMVMASDFFKSIQRQLLLQTEFINIAAHELKTPIMPILVNTEILEEELGDKYEEVRLIARNARRLQRLTENILNVARIESGTLKLSKERFGLNQTISGVIREETLKLENKKVQLIQDAGNDEIFIYADKDRMIQIISNLLNNALKFTEKGKITITSRTVGQLAIVNVVDSGSGIPDEITPLLFSKFATKSVTGTGLGLYICKNIIEAHGGKIWAKNNDNEAAGATFGFSIPLADS